MHSLARGIYDHLQSQPARLPCMRASFGRGPFTSRLVSVAETTSAPRGSRSRAARSAWDNPSGTVFRSVRQKTNPPDQPTAGLFRFLTVRRRVDFIDQSKTRELKTMQMLESSKTGYARSVV